MENELPDGPIIEVGDWIKWRKPGQRVEVSEVSEVTARDSQDGCYVECGYFIHSRDILEVRTKGTP